ncbi:MAG: hypothetical protein RR614_06950 [Eubacterium sp.]
MFSIGFCSWDLPALLLLAVILSVYILRRQRLKHSCEALEEEIATKKAAKEKASEPMKEE